METNCQELFKKFQKIGGQFNCKYDTNEGEFITNETIIKCKDLHNISSILDIFLFETSCSYYKMIKEIPLTNNDKPIKKNTQISRFTIKRNTNKI